MKTNRDALVRTNTVLTDMKQSSAQLRTSLRDVKTSMEQTLMDPQCSSPVAAPTCDSIRKSLSVLDGSANFDHVRRGQSCSRAASLGRLGSATTLPPEFFSCLILLPSLPPTIIPQSTHKKLFLSEDLKSQRLGT